MLARGRRLYFLNATWHVALWRRLSNTVIFQRFESVDEILENINPDMTTSDLEAAMYRISRLLRGSTTMRYQEDLNDPRFVTLVRSLLNAVSIQSHGSKFNTGNIFLALANLPKTPLIKELLSKLQHFLSINVDLFSSAQLTQLLKSAGSRKLRFSQESLNVLLQQAELRIPKMNAIDVATLFNSLMHLHLGKHSIVEPLCMQAYWMACDRDPRLRGQQIADILNAIARTHIDNVECQEALCRRSLEIIDSIDAISVSVQLNALLRLQERHSTPAAKHLIVALLNQASSFSNFDILLVSACIRALATDLQLVKEFQQFIPRLEEVFSEFWEQLEPKNRVETINAAKSIGIDILKIFKSKLKSLGEVDINMLTVGQVCAFLLELTFDSERFDPRFFSSLCTRLMEGVEPVPPTDVAVALQSVRRVVSRFDWETSESELNQFCKFLCAELVAYRGLLNPKDIAMNFDALLGLQTVFYSEEAIDKLTTHTVIQPTVFGIEECAMILRAAADLRLGGKEFLLSQLLTQASELIHARGHSLGSIIDLLYAAAVLKPVDGKRFPEHVLPTFFSFCLENIGNVTNSEEAVRILFASACLQSHLQESVLNELCGQLMDMVNRDFDLLDTHHANLGILAVLFFRKVHPSITIPDGLLGNFRQRIEQETTEESSEIRDLRDSIDQRLSCYRKTWRNLVHGPSGITMDFVIRQYDGERVAVFIGSRDAYFRDSSRPTGKGRLENKVRSRWLRWSFVVVPPNDGTLKALEEYVNKF